VTPSLNGIRALVTRPPAQGAALAAAIRAAGGAATALPLIEIQPLDAADATRIAHNARVLAELDQFDMAIFVSTNAVNYALATLEAAAHVVLARLPCFAIGTATSARLTAAGIPAAGGETAMNSEELLRHAALRAARGRRVLIFKGVGGREHLAEELRHRGAIITECALYHRVAPRTTRAEFEALLRRERINVILLSSSDALANLLRLPGADAAGTIAADTTVVVPSERVARLAREAGYRTVEIAANATDGAMMQALQSLLTRNPIPS
jgi:uroporphyrinogen-III synthase